MCEVLPLLQLQHTRNSRTLQTQTGRSRDYDHQLERLTPDLWPSQLTLFWPSYELFLITKGQRLLAAVLSGAGRDWKHWLSKLVFNWKLAGHRALHYSSLRQESCLTHPCSCSSSSGGSGGGGARILHITHTWHIYNRDKRNTHTHTHFKRLLLLRIWFIFVRFILVFAVFKLLHQQFPLYDFMFPNYYPPHPIWGHIS